MAPWVEFSFGLWHSLGNTTSRTTETKGACCGLRSDCSNESVGCIVVLMFSRSLDGWRTGEIGGGIDRESKEEVVDEADSTVKMVPDSLESCASSTNFSDAFLSSVSCSTATSFCSIFSLPTVLSPCVNSSCLIPSRSILLWSMLAFSFSGEEVFSRIAFD